MREGYAVKEPVTSSSVRLHLHAPFCMRATVGTKSFINRLGATFFPSRRSAPCPCRAPEGIGPGERLLHLAQCDLEGAVASRRIDLISTIGREVEWMNLESDRGLDC